MLLPPAYVEVRHCLCILSEPSGRALFSIDRGDPARSTLTCQNSRGTQSNFWPFRPNLTGTTNSGFPLAAAPLRSREGDGPQLPKGSN